MATKDELATMPRKKVLGGMATVERESAILTAEIDTIDKKLADAVEIHAVTASIVGANFHLAVKVSRKPLLRQKDVRASRYRKCLVFFATMPSANSG